MKTRKQWIAMLLMLAMLFTALPIAAFAEDPPAPQEEQGNNWTGESVNMEVNVWYGMGNDDIGAYIYNSPEWNSAQKNLTEDELNALQAFYDNLLADAAFEYKDDDGNWVRFTPTEWKTNPYATHLRSIEIPKGKKVRMTVPTSKLPENFSLGEFKEAKNRAYIGDTSVSPYDEDFNINLYAIKYKVKFSNGNKTDESYISRDGVITYPDKPTRDGYLFKDWIVPIYYTKDLSLGGGTSGTTILISPSKGAGTSEHVAVLEHGDTNDTFRWTYNHFYWAYEQDKPKSPNPRTLYARWERPTLTFYKKVKDENPTNEDVLQTNKAYNGKSLQDTDWAQNTDLDKITKLPKAKAPAGMKFKGWVYYDANNGPHPFDMKTKVDGNMNLYPVFEKSATPNPGTPSEPSAEYVDIVFEANEGAWASGETRREYRSAVGSVITIESAPMREGYKFLYWKGSEFHPGENYTVPAGGHTFVAQWEKVEKKPEDKPSAPSIDAKIKTPRGSALTPEEIAKILAGTKKVVPAIPRAGVGR